MYLIKKDNKYLTKNKYPDWNKQGKYIWTRSYWMSYLFTYEEAEQLIKQYDNSIMNDEYEENARLFEDIKPFERSAFPNTL